MSTVTGNYQQLLQQGLQGALGNSIGTAAQGISIGQAGPFAFYESLTQEEIKWLKKLFSYEPLRRKLLLMSKDGEIPEEQPNVAP